MRINKYFDSIKSRNVFIKFLSNTFLVLMIPFLILTVVYFSLNAKLQEQAYERNLGILESSVEKMELLYDNMDQIGFYLSEDPEIIRYYNIGYAMIGNSITDMLRAQNALSAIRVGNGDIMNIQLYSGKSDTLVDYYTNAFFFDRYYGSSFLVQDMNSRQFRMSYLDVTDSIQYRSAVVKAEGKTEETLIYNKQYVSTDSGMGRGRILFYIGMDRMLQLFAPLEYDNGGFLYMLDGESRVVFEDNPAGYETGRIDTGSLTEKMGYTSLTLDGRKLFLTWYRSEHRGWICVEAVPVSNLLAITREFRWLMFLLLSLAALVGIVLVLLVSRKLSAPLIEIGNVLGSRDRQVPMGEFVEEVKMLMERNSVLVERMQQQVSAMRTEAFYKFLTGECTNEEEISEIINMIGLKKDACRYVILLVSCNDINMDARLEDISVQKVYLENIIMEQRFEEVEDIYHIDFARMVVFMTFGEESVKRVKERAEELVGAVKETIAKDTIYSISVGGDVVEDVLKLPEAFVHSQKALNIPQNVFGVHKVQWYERAKQYLDMETYEFNVSEKNVSLSNLVLVDKIKKYIHENYSDPQLSLSQVGEEFCITEVYLSKLFKQATGENFSKYVESIRMTQAKELMDQKKKVAEVAGMVGYNSPQVFRRAWKRYYGDE